MPEEQQPKSNQPAPPKSLSPRRRGHRGGRGRRRPAPAISISEQPVQTKLSAQTEPPMRLREEMPVRPAPSKPKFQLAAPVPSELPKEKFQPVPRKNDPDGSAISQAVNEVTQVVDSLRQSLEQMEEVLELVELAERQKLTDEREIESLLRALRQLQSRGGRAERPERQERPQPNE
ncbi:MAG TPA: hypothetical protein VGM58_02110 [Verrucomicrobiae bacterium]